MLVHLLQAVQSHDVRSSKDTNGGYGSANDFGSGLTAVLLKRLKRQTMNFPEILPAYLHAILKQQGHTMTYGVNQVNPAAQVVLIQTSIIHYTEELAWVQQIRRQMPHARIGFVGGMSAGNPDRYLNIGDFVVTGEAENALLKYSLDELSGLVDGGFVDDLDRLPFPDWSHLPAQEKTYGFLRGRKGRFLPMLSSRGCPMSCAYYCTYPLTQGAAQRARSAENTVEEMVYLQERYQVGTVMFRDPIFSLKMNRIDAICNLILEKGLKISWVCETHPRFLTPELIAKMAQAGCMAVKLGIESGSLEVMKKSRRAAADLAYQEQIIRCCEKQGIDVLGFYILGYYADTPQTIAQTVQYALSLNTYGAQFTIATPYPGTPWYADLAKDPCSKLDENLEHYNQYRLVYTHPHLTFAQLERLKSQAYQRYYVRFAYVFKHIWRLVRRLRI